MAHDSSHNHNNTYSKNNHKSSDLEHISQTPSKVALARGPAFVVWVSATNGKTRGFITWAETAVAELSPYILDAWHFPTAKAANDSVARALGPAAEDFGTAVFPAPPPRQ